MIRKPFDSVVPCVQPKGSGVEDDIRLKRDVNGNCTYLKVGEKNVREYVASFEAGCSLNALLQRCSLMPVYDKLKMLNQCPDGISFDTSILPKDLTEAVISINSLERSNPELVERFRKGESFNDIINSMLIKEVTTDGENESINE